MSQAALARAVRAMESVTVFVTSKERAKRPEGEAWWREEIEAARLASVAPCPNLDELAREAAMRACEAIGGCPCRKDGWRHPSTFCDARVRGALEAIALAPVHPPQNSPAGGSSAEER